MASLPALPSSMVMELRSRFPKASAAGEYFSVPHLMEIRRKNGINSLKKCVSYNYPTLRDLAQSHGTKCATLLVQVYIVNLNDSGNVQRMTGEQIAETAELIYEEFPTLKITELYEFIRRVKTGKYGEFYGSMDCIKIMSDFREFLQDRAAALATLVREKEHEIRERQRLFQEKLPAERETYLKTLTAAEMISLMICPACHSNLIDGAKGTRCISCDYKK